VTSRQVRQRPFKIRRPHETSIIGCEDRGGLICNRDERWDVVGGLLDQSRRSAVGDR
jgi:hypothetical protein